MRLYLRRSHDAALACAGGGEPALYLASHDAGRLYDLDTARLVSTARRLGAGQPVVHHLDTPAQHVRLEGLPLLRALRECHREGVPR
jgi:hypothetical protein